MAKLKQSAKPRPLSPTARYHFDQFTSSCNRTVPHSLDWEQFYEFIRASHFGRARATEGDVCKHLRAAGFEDEAASTFASVYDHGRRILKRAPLNAKPDPNRPGEWIPVTPYRRY